MNGRPEVTSADLPAPVDTVMADDPLPPPFRPQSSFSWLVQLRDGRHVRVDADRVDTGNGILAFYCGHRADLLVAAFEYGDWKRVAWFDRTAGKADGWAVLKEGRKRE